jgi:hypothetical protein
MPKTIEPTEERKEVRIRSSNDVGGSLPPPDVLALLAPAIGLSDGRIR